MIEVALCIGVEHDPWLVALAVLICSVGAFARFNPQACISGSTTVGSEVLVGANATVLQGLALGDGCVVGAGAVVVRDVGRGTTVKGVPAR